ncbi:MAG TPA: 3D-(3,5/4)-trihydroxycyclohexane-1,2-dione acylhydrolase (decyclizing) [Clostridiales bacterium]|nr:3D-(3,5/4)-trihydroxycyclohexane-1,2-dione acylhydrolase (decyclizing) [Clostridiales bacterium]
MQRIRLTMTQALVRFLDNQYLESDQSISKFVTGMFGVFGHGCVCGVGQALEQGDHSLCFYQGKNEQGMALAAMAYAKQLNRRAIIPCVSSIGPGALNMVTAAGCATANRIPLLLLPGDTFACRQPDPVLQQTEIFSSIGTTVNDAFRSVCRYWDRIERPEQLMSAAIQAMRVLTDPAETGAVCLALPQDVEGEAYDYPEDFLKKRVWHLDRRPLAASQLQRACQLIRTSRKPLIIVGGGVRYSEAGTEVQALAETCNIPIAETQAGKGLIAWDHPLNLGGIGVTGTQAANVIAREADLILGIGTRFSDFTTCSKWLFQNPDAQVLSINICPFDAVKMNGEAIIADAREAVASLVRALPDYRSDYGGEIAQVKAEWQAIADRYYSDGTSGSAGCSTGFVNFDGSVSPNSEPGLSQTAALGEINRFMAPADIAVGSAGSLPGDMQRLFQPGRPGTYHVEYGFSNMGYEINGALGVKMACPQAEVYTFTGDGSYIMAHSELYTSIQENLKIYVCLFDNSGWGCIENLQNSQGTATFGTTFAARDTRTGRLNGRALPVDFAANAASYGAKAYTIHTLAELRAALKDSKKETRSVLFDIKVRPGSMSPGFTSWWRVGVAAVAADPAVGEAYERMEQKIRETRDF